MENSKARKENWLVVEVLIFSGRPNPIFTIKDPKEIEEVMSLLKDLPQHPTLKNNDTVLPAVLGYRGLAVENLSTTASDVEAFVVSRSDVQLSRKLNATEGGVKSDFRKDGAKAIQRKLLEIGKAHGDISDDLLRLIDRKK